MLASQVLHRLAHSLGVWVAQGVDGGRAVAHGDGDGALLAGDRQVHRVRRSTLPDLELPLRPEPLLLERDEQPVGPRRVQVVDLLGGGEAIPRGLDLVYALMMIMP